MDTMGNEKCQHKIFRKERHVYVDLNYLNNLHWYNISLYLYFLILDTTHG